MDYVIWLAGIVVTGTGAALMMLFNRVSKLETKVNEQSTEQAVLLTEVRNSTHRQELHQSFEVAAINEIKEDYKGIKEDIGEIKVALAKLTK